MTPERLAEMKRYYRSNSEQAQAIRELIAEVERLAKHHVTLATVCRNMKGPCICGCHTGTTTMEEQSHDDV